LRWCYTVLSSKKKHAILSKTVVIQSKNILFMWNTSVDLPINYVCLCKRYLLCRTLLFNCRNMVLACLNTALFSQIAMLFCPNFRLTCLNNVLLCELVRVSLQIMVIHILSTILICQTITLFCPNADIPSHYAKQ
jgi:hypothetical protein